MAEAVSSVSRMREFRRYVANTAGRRLVQLWMDIERFHRIDVDDERTRWLRYREIQITFYEFYESPPPAAKTCPLADDLRDVGCVLVGTLGSAIFVASTVTRLSVFCYLFWMTVTRFSR